MTTLKGKTALITGASTLNGIGRACAKRLATDGANVVVTDMPGQSEDGSDRMVLLENLAAEINRSGGTALALPLDVTDAQQIANATATATKSFGAIDVLVNNAGTLAGTGPFMTTTADQWDLSFRINILGPMLLCQAVIPSMQKTVGDGLSTSVQSRALLRAKALAPTLSQNTGYWV
jgi:3-oxoacyl-[acyl-carrier protein] reductase